MDSPFSSNPFEGTPARASFRIAEIDFDNSPRSHRISKALFIPKYFHKFILPTLPEDDQLQMEPLNWEFGVRANRPFEQFSGPPGARLPNLTLKSPSIRERRFRGEAVRAEDVFDQPNFWELAAPIFDPYNQKTENEQAESGPVKMWLESFMIYLVALWELWIALSLALWETLKAATPFVVLGGKELAKRLKWRVILSLFLATQLVRLLPGLEGGVEASVEAQIEALRDPAPLYVIMIPITRLSKLPMLNFSGPVLTESSHSIGFRLSTEFGLSWCEYRFVHICI